MSCRSGCPTQDHTNWGECARQSGLQVGDLTGVGVARTTNKRLELYASAKRQGIQPPTTQLRHVQDSLRAAGA
jgi:hypothetical protein